MSFSRITTADTAGKGVVGLADTPGLSTTAMQQKFDELATDVIIPKFNVLATELEGNYAASNLGILPVEGYSSANVQDLLEAINSRLIALNNSLSATGGASLIGELSQGNVQTALNVLNTYFANIYSTNGASLIGEQSQGNIQAAVNALNTLFSELYGTAGASKIGEPTHTTVQGALNYIYTALGQLSSDIAASGDMHKSVYDTDLDGIVDHAEIADAISDLDKAGIQAKLTAGPNITIAGNVISASGGGSAEIEYGTTADFNTQQAALPVGASYFVTDDYVEGGNIYSTAEIAVGKWYDGQTIYRKLFLLPSQLIIANNSWTTSSISKAANGIIDIIGARGWGRSNNHLEFRFDLMASLSVNPTYVSFLSDRTNASVSADVIALEYLKGGV